jgi:single-stranded DNA-binding protein
VAGVEAVYDVADLNFVVLTGVSTKEATLRPKTSGQVKAEFSLQVDRPFMRPDGVPVSDLFLIDSWGELAKWAYENVRNGTRVLVIGTLNKESYVTRGGGKEHLTVIKAKVIELIGSQRLNEDVDLDEVRKDDWTVEVVGQHIQAISDAVASLV